MRKLSYRSIVDKNPVAAYADALLGVRLERLRAAAKDGEVGASAIELAIITAILVGLAVAVLIVINTVVTQRKTEITTNNNGIP
jgi:Flp pilus assembly pilin Flp